MANGKGMTKALVALMTAGMALMGATAAGAAEEHDSAHQAASAGAATGATVVSDADVAFDLGILQGEGNGLTAEYLNRSTTRIQAAILFLRLKGLEAAASTYAGSEHFVDVSKVWSEGQSILAYLKANPQLGWQGTGDNRFDPLSPITSEQFAKVLLEALDYKQGVDFEYKDVLVKAESVGLNAGVAGKQLRNHDIAAELVESLQIKLKGGSQTLAGQLGLKADKLQALQYKKLVFAEPEEGNPYLTDGNGMSLYMFKKDLTDLNACQGACLTNWPVFHSDPLKIPANLNKADFGILVRPDGTKQTTFRGWPLYYYAADTQPGETNGQGFKNIWYLIEADMLSREASVPKTYNVEMSGFMFTVPELTIAAGSKVTFTNRDSMMHNVAALDGSFRTDLLAEGESVTLNFDKPGIYEYVCEPHKKKMKGVIIVK